MDRRRQARQAGSKPVRRAGRAAPGLVFVAMLGAACSGPSPLRIPREGVLTLPPGALELVSELVAPEGACELEIRGAASGTILRAAKEFRGRALIVVRSASRVRIANLTIDGNRAALARPVGLPPSDVFFARFYPSNGILAENVETLSISGVKFVNVANFPILVARSRGVRIERVIVEDSGSLDLRGRNNTSGGILLEEGTSEFEVRDCVFRRIRGNAIWTHSLYSSARNRDGLIIGNRFEEVARDAIQIGHATNIRVENNSGTRIGYPISEVDPAATPAAIDTAGNTDQTVYAFNRFEDVNGKCIDLDGFHHGEVRNNSCVNRRPRAEYPNGHFGIVMNNTNPDMRCEAIRVINNELDGAVYGGIFVIGSGHTIVGNRMRNLNLARCAPGRPGCIYWADEPALLSSGIYLGRRAERPAISRQNRILDNEVSGFGMRRNCIAAAPGVSLAENQIDLNRCADQ